jgi:hypothetical protein
LTDHPQPLGPRLYRPQSQRSESGNRHRGLQLHHARAGAPQAETEADARGFRNAVRIWTALGQHAEVPYDSPGCAKQPTGSSNKHQRVDQYRRTLQADL